MVGGLFWVVLFGYLICLLFAGMLWALWCCDLVGFVGLNYFITVLTVQVSVGLLVFVVFFFCVCLDLIATLFCLDFTWLIFVILMI